MYFALYIAKYIVTYCKNKNKPISNMSLQNILFLLQKSGKINILETPKSNGTFLFYPEVYYHFCGFGASPIEMEYSIALDDSLKKEINKIIDTNLDKELWDFEIFEKKEEEKDGQG